MSGSVFGRIVELILRLLGHGQRPRRLVLRRRGTGLETWRLGLQPAYVPIRRRTPRG